MNLSAKAVIYYKTVQSLDLIFKRNQVEEAASQPSQVQHIHSHSGLDLCGIKLTELNLHCMLSCLSITGKRTSPT